MPAHGNQHAASGFSRHDNSSTRAGAGSHNYPLTQPLGSTGTLAQSSSAMGSFVVGGGGQRTPPNSMGPPRPNDSLAVRSQSFGRLADELHVPSNFQATGQQHSILYNQSQEVYRALPHTASALPVQAAGYSGGGRPAPISANTAPSAVPTLPPISTQYSTSSRGSTAHSYSRSSPDAKFPSTPSNKYMSAPTSQGVAFSPLGLADIRPRSDSVNDDPPGAYLFGSPAAAPANCNYLAPWAVYAFDWCKWPVQQQQGAGDSAGKMAIGSYLEDGHNYIQILDTRIIQDPDPEPVSGAAQYGLEYIKTAEASHSYPVTRILWEPQSSQKKTCDLLATSGDHLRLWSLPQSKSYNVGNSINRPANTGESAVQKLTPLALLSNSKSPEHTAPLTSLDWNVLSPSLIITSSIDTTCTIWDIPSLTAKTQLIAHDKEVFDVRFCANSVDVFVSCGADGSVRMFDLRSLEHSTIIYEPSEKNDKSSSPGDMSPTRAQQTMSHAPPLLRLAASPHDAHLLATFSQDSSVIRILDVRQPGQALLELQGHRAPLNCMEWSPSRRGTLASGGDDSLVLLWDLLNQGNATPVPGSNGANGTGPETARGPAASWQCDYEVNNLSWAPQSALTSKGGDWLGVSGGRGVWSVGL